jgi:flagellar biosynthesis chaperone FliJ
MARFRFRAQAALDLRRRQDEEAQRALADARQATRKAQAALAHEEEVLAETLERGRLEEASAQDTTRAVWYRNWMRRQRGVIEAARAAMEERRTAEREMAARAVVARRKLRALERLRERLWTAYLDAERRAEQKEMDVLGGLRFLANRSLPGGA